MPVEIDLLKMYANGLERVLEANLTNLFVPIYLFLEFIAGMGAIIMLLVTYIFVSFELLWMSLP